jgi:hypothetical protein
MLHAVQAHFLPRVRAAIPAATAVTTGPVADPTDADPAARVVLAAVHLAITVSDDPTEHRGTVQFGAVHRWSGDGTTRDFLVPDMQARDVAELECPPGRPLRAGDDYAVDGRTIRLMRPAPVGQDNLLVRLRGGPARGYLDKRPCTVTLLAHVWAADAAQLAPLSARVHAALLAASADVPHLEAAPQDDLGVRVRLLRPVAVWTATTRAAVPIGQTLFIRDTLEFKVHGELEQRVVLGQPEPVGVIESIVYNPSP